MNYHYTILIIFIVSQLLSSNELDVGKETSSSDCDVDSSIFSSLDPNNHEKTPPKNDAIKEKGFISILNKLPKKELGCSSVCAG